MKICTGEIKTGHKGMTHSRQETCRKFMYHTSVPGIHAVTYVRNMTRRYRHNNTPIRSHVVFNSQRIIINNFSLVNTFCATSLFGRREGISWLAFWRQAKEIYGGARILPEKKPHTRVTVASFAAVMVCESVTLLPPKIGGKVYIPYPFKISSKNP